MAKVLVFQHVPAEPLGTLDPMLRNRGHRIRYVNFHRDPDAQPDVSRYDALIVLGGPQMPDQGDIHPHLNVEMRCIEQALRHEVPVLGICLGAQLLAEVGRDRGELLAHARRVLAGDRGELEGRLVRGRAGARVLDDRGRLDQDLEIFDSDAGLEAGRKN